MAFRRTARYLLAAALAFALLPHPEGLGARVPVVDIPPGTELAPSILFQSEIPLKGFDPLRPSDGRRKEFAALAARLSGDSTLFLALQLRLDPVGARQEQSRWSSDFLQVVASRLGEAGVPADRMILLPPERDSSWFGSFPWKDVEGRQALRIRGLRGGDWLRRKTVAEAPSTPTPPPPPGGVFIVEPAEGRTDRSLQTVRGTVEGDARTVAVSVNRETQAASVFGGNFGIPVSLRNGENRIAVTAIDSYGRAFSASRNVFYSPPRPTVEIHEPPAGSRADTTRAPAITVRGVVRSKAPVRELFLEQNGMPHPIPISPDGTFQRKAVLVTEQDVFRVEAVDTAGERGASESRTVTATTVAERPLLAFLHWDRGDVDLDLHVTDGLGHTSNFDAPDIFAAATAIPTGRFWIDDREGYGPEAFSVEDSTPGSYRFFVEYYRGKQPCRAWLTVVLFSGTPSRRTVRVFGPVHLSPEAHRVPLVEVSIPSGTIKESPEMRERKQP